MVTSSIVGEKSQCIEILLVEDSPLCQKVMCRLLQRSLEDMGYCDYAITTASTLHEAYESLDAQRFNLIICDYNLGSERAGPELIGPIRKNASHINSETPVIAFSSEVEGVDDLRGTSMDGFIPKQARLELVQPVLWKYLPGLLIASSSLGGAGFR